MVIRRTGLKTNELKKLVLDFVGDGTNFDGTKDIPLQFGDVVHVFERDHTLSEPVIDVTYSEDQTLVQALRRNVTFLVKGQRHEVALAGRANFAYLSQVTLRSEVKKILRSTSDLSRLKIKRTDPATGKTREILMNAELFLAYKIPLHEDLWLRDGDIIEVPDKS